LKTEFIHLRLFNLISAAVIGIAFQTTRFLLEVSYKMHFSARSI